MNLKYNYFRLSKPIKDPRNLLEYFLWIAGLGIPCCVAREKTGWALWREGVEAMESPNINSKPNNVKMSSEVCMVYDPEDVFGLRKKAGNP